jgi:hypothetical protein
MPEYFVVSRAHAGIRFGKDDALILRSFPSGCGPVDILVRTRLRPAAEFGKSIPAGLVAEARGTAPTLNAALQEFSRAVQSVCPVLVFLANSPVEDMTPELGYGVGEGLTEREFFQQFLSEDPIPLIERRRLSSDLVVRVLAALGKHTEFERLHRALAQYYQALRNWQPGQEILALAHLWMGVEALTPVVLRRVLASEGVDRDGLAAKWSVAPRAIDAEVRKRLILNGDEEAYKKAKSASDGFEHGFLGIAEVKAHSEAVRQGVASHLRRAILQELLLDPADETIIQSAPYDKPGHLHTAKYLRGTLEGTGDNLAADGQAYPILSWKTAFREVPNPDSDDIKFKIEETITPRLAEGISLSNISIEVWGGQESNIQRADV